MQKVVRHIIFAFFVLLGSYNSKAQPDTFYFLKGVPQTKDMNPARPGIARGFYFSMPLFSKLDLSANTNNWSFSDLIHQGSGDQTKFKVYDFQKLLSSLDKNNFVNESAALTLLEFGLKSGNNFYAFSWTEHEFAEPFFTRSLANLIYYGNVPYIGSTYQTGYFGVGAQHYRDFSLTFSRDMTSKISVGITGKLLFGMAAVKTSGINIVAGMPINGDQIELAASGQAFISAPVQMKLINDSSGYKLFSKNNFEINSYLSNFANPGLAVDLGFSSRINEQLEFSISLVDLGFITWQKDINIFAENGSFVFRGVNLNTPTATNKPPVVTDVASLFIPLRDSLRVPFLPVQTSTGFTTLLPVKLYVAGEYSLSKDLSLGGVGRVRMFNNMLHTSLTASVNASVSSNFSVSASYSVMESTFNNLGVAAAFRMGSFQLYAASDNLFSFFSPTTASNANLRVGINLIFRDDVKPGRTNSNRRSVRNPPGCPL